MKKNTKALEALLDAGVVARATTLFENNSDRLDLDFMRGRVGLFCGESPNSSTTLAAYLVHEIQREREPAVWLTDSTRLPHAPDLLDVGIDLEAMPILRLADAKDAAHAAMMAVASGAFGGLIWDLDAPEQLTRGTLTALGMLARRHHVAIVLLCHGKKMPSLDVDCAGQITRRKSASSTGALEQIELELISNRRHRFHEHRQLDQPCEEASREVYLRLFEDAPTPTVGG